MAVKIVTLNGSKLMYVTNFDVDEETSTNTTSTFDGVITEGNPENPFSISIERVNYESAASYVEIRDILNSMRTTPGTIVSYEAVYPKGEEAFTIMRTYNNCILDGRGHKIDAEKMTVHNLKFKASSCVEDDPIMPVVTR